MDRVFALVDCENFYVSCERVFDPALQSVGVAFRDVPSGPSQKLEIKYELGSSSEDRESYSFDIVDASGNDIDGSTTYDLSSSTNPTTSIITLSSQERQYLNDNGVLYIVIEDDDVLGDADQTVYRIYYLRVVSSG